MSKTDGLLLEKIDSISNETLNRICLFAVITWAISPIVMLALNFFNVSEYTFHGVITIVLYFSGCIGLIFGGIYNARLIKSNLNIKNIMLERMQPVLAVAILLIWCMFCTLFADEKRMAIYGYESLKDNLLTFLFFGGLFLAAQVVSSNDRQRDMVQLVIMVVGTVASVSSLMLGTPAILGSSGISSVANSDIAYFGEYLILVLAIIISIIFKYDKKSVLVLILPICFVEIELLIINDIASILVMAIVTLMVFAFGMLNNNSVMYKSLIIFALMIFVFLFSVFLRDDLSFVEYYSAIRSFSYDRIHKWNDACKFILSVPVVGVGPQNTVKLFDGFLFQSAAYLGVPGLLILVYGLISTLKFIPKNHKNLIPILMVFFISISISNCTYYILAYYFVMLGFCTISNREELIA